MTMALHPGHGYGLKGHFKGHKVKLFMLAYFVVLMTLAGFGYYAGDFYTEQRRINALNESNKFATDIGFVSMPELNMSLATEDGGNGRIRLEISLKAEKKNLIRLEGYQPYIADRFVSFLRKKDSDELRQKGAMPLLRKELLREANVASYPVPVMDVIFDRFLVQ
jgi:flagellar basal body-associated protein FliL